MTGKLSFRGEIGLGMRLGKYLREAVETRVHDGAGPGEAKTEMVLAEKWQRNEDAPACAVCRESFKARYDVYIYTSSPFYGISVVDQNLVALIIYCTVVPTFKF